MWRPLFTVAGVLLFFTFANVDGVASDCSTLQCADGKMCKLYKGVRAYCVRDSSVCDLPNETKEFGCGSASRYFYNKLDRKCQMFTSGECSANRNAFPTMRDCYITCRYVSGFFRRSRVG